MSSTGSTVENKRATGTTRRTRAGQNVVDIDISDTEAPGAPAETTSPAATARLDEMMAAFQATWPAYRSQPESERVIDSIVAREDDGSLQEAVRTAPDPAETETV